MATKKPFIAKHGLTVGNTATGGDFTFPSSDGSASQVIVTDGSGSLSWATQSGGLSDVTAESLEDLSDVYSSMSPTDGQILVYDTTNGWQAETYSGGGGTAYTTAYVSTDDPGMTENVAANGWFWISGSDNSKKLWSCIDNTTDNNDWAILFGLEDPNWVYGGTNYGYVSGGKVDSGFPQFATYEIQKFSFSSDANATSVGSLVAGGTQSSTTQKTRWGLTGHSSKEYGYAAGGRYTTSNPSIPENNIQKFPFASDSDAGNVGTLATGSLNATGLSSPTFAFIAGDNYPTYSSGIQRFPFASDSDSTDLGSGLLQATTIGAAGQSSSDYGYISGGRNSSSYYFTYSQKFPWASPSDGTTTVGNLSLGTGNTNGRYAVVGQSSSDYGYTSAGNVPGIGKSNIIDKFPFASDANATDVGDLTVARWFPAGQSSSEYGYTSGGYVVPTRSNVIDKFPFASDANATDVGDLIRASQSQGGHHY